MIQSRSLLASLTALGAFLLFPAAALPARADEDPSDHRFEWFSEDGLLATRGGFLGVRTLEMTAELRSHYGAPQDAGVLVGKVVEDSPAASAGIQVGDILTQLNGKRIDHPFGLIRALGNLEEGDSVTLQIFRDGRRQELSAVLAKRTAPQITTLGPGIHFLPKYDFNFQSLEDLRDLPQLEGLQGLGQNLQYYFQSPEWQDSLEKMKLERGDLQERLQEMEKRLQEMEKRLEEMGNRT
ncbi:MAG: PDZ domain-containing protein [Acidobacteria bacterium]|nr:PDZ domain-containing protein [Acidobacteriota bacterium]